MIRYCRTADCLRAFLLRYFGEESPERCGECGNCLHPPEERDITVQAQMILSCVKRIHSSLRYYVGADLLIKVLRGSTERRVRELGLTGLSTWGILKDTSREEIRSFLDALLEQGYLLLEPEHRTLRLSAQAGDVLFRHKPVITLVRREREETPRRGGPFRLRTPEECLARELKKLRGQLAEREQIPAWRVCSNRTLDAMAHLRPRTMGDLLRVPGMEEGTARQYGRAFLQAVGESAASGNGTGR